ncbi:Zn-dependent metalloprotease [Peribacillus frigoritolerans]
MKELSVMKGKVFLGTALSIGLLFSAIPHQEALAAKNVLSVEKYNKHRDSLEYKSGKLTDPSKQTAEDIILTFFDENKKSYKLEKQKAKDSFTIEKESKDELGNTVLKLQQTYKGVPVWNSTQAVLIDAKGCIDRRVRYG